MALLAAAPSWRVRASFRRDKSFFGGGKPTRVRLQRAVAGGLGRASRYCPRDCSGLDLRSLFAVGANVPRKTRRDVDQRVVVAIGLLGGITIVAFAVPSIPAGFSLGTISISASAIVFLIGVSLATAQEAARARRIHGREGSG